MLESQYRATGSSGVPHADSLVVGARDDNIAVSRHKATGAHVIGMTAEHSTRRVGREVPQTNGLVVTGAHQGCQIGRRPFCYPDGLFVQMPCLKYHCSRATSNVKHLYLSRVLACDQYPAIGSDLTTMGLAVEAADCLERLSFADGEDIDTRPFCLDSRNQTSYSKRLAHKPKHL